MKPPKKLSQKAKSVWKEIEESASKKLNKADYAMIEQFCNEMDIYDEAVKEINEKGFESAHKQVSPAVTVRNQAANNMRQCYKAISSIIEVKEDSGESTKAMELVKNF